MMVAHFEGRLGQREGQMKVVENLTMKAEVKRMVTWQGKSYLYKNYVTKNTKDYGNNCNICCYT